MTPNSVNKPDSPADVLSATAILAGITALIWWFAGRKLASPVMDEYADYYSTQVRNREMFEKNFDSDIRVFKALLSKLRSIWARVGTTRGISGHSHVGLLPFSNILVRHVIFGFEHLACYQSFLGWLTFRPGLEALLMIGKFVDDPANAHEGQKLLVLPLQANQLAKRGVAFYTAAEPAIHGCFMNARVFRSLRY